MMKHWREVLMLINATTHEEIKDPVSDAINHLAGVFYDTYTAMVTTTSKCRAGEGSRASDLRHSRKAPCRHYVHKREITINPTPDS